MSQRTIIIMMSLVSVIRSLFFPASVPRFSSFFFVVLVVDVVADTSGDVVVAASHTAHAVSEGTETQPNVLAPTTAPVSLVETKVEEHLSVLPPSDSIYHVDEIRPAVLYFSGA